MSSESSEDRPTRSSWSRRSFLQSSAGVATGVAVSVVTPAAAIALSPASAAAATLPDAVAADPAFGVPSEPVTAYLRDAASGEVTVMSGTVERTYRDPVLAQRLMDAAKSQDPTQTEVK